MHHKHSGRTPAQTLKNIVNNRPMFSLSEAEIAAIDMGALQREFADSPVEEKEFLVRAYLKSLSHRFAIKGFITLPTGSLRLEAAWSSQAFLDLWQNTRQMSASAFHPEVFSEPEAQAAFWQEVSRSVGCAVRHQFDDDALTTSVRDASQDGRLVFSKTGIKEHFCGQLFTKMPDGKHYYIFANRGGSAALHASGIYINSYDPDKLTAVQLKEMQEMASLADVDGDGSGSIQERLDLVPVAHLPMQKQKVGNCTFANSNALVFAAMIMERIRQAGWVSPETPLNTAMIGQAAADVRPMYKQWKYQAKLNALRATCTLFADKHYHQNFGNEGVKRLILDKVLEKLSSAKPHYHPGSAELYHWQGYKYAGLKQLLGLLLQDNGMHVDDRLGLLNRLYEVIAQDRHLPAPYKTALIAEAEQTIIQFVDQRCQHAGRLMGSAFITMPPGSRAKSILDGRAQVWRRLYAAAAALKESGLFSKATQKTSALLLSVYQSADEVPLIGRQLLSDSSLGLSEREICRFARLNLAVATQVGNLSQLQGALKVFEKVVLLGQEKQLNPAIKRYLGHPKKYMTVYEEAQAALDKLQLFEEIKQHVMQGQLGAAFGRFKSLVEGLEQQIGRDEISMAQAKAQIATLLQTHDQAQADCAAIKTGLAQCYDSFDVELGESVVAQLNTDMATSLISFSADGLSVAGWGKPSAGAGSEALQGGMHDDKPVLVSAASTLSSAASKAAPRPGG